ncbi:MAG: metallophosphatase family protein [Gemmataceae bacterium]|nr:metallophosphatase family protein [Gemmataceae bacterium]
MNIAVLSDTHSRAFTIERVLAQIRNEKVALLIHCGDIEDADTVRLFPANSHFVFGNCDWDRSAIRQAVDEIGATLHEPFGHLDLEGKTLGFVHGDDKRLLLELENSGAYDFVFYGHTHQAREHRSGKTRVINPGALHRAKPKSFVFLELPSGKVVSVLLE